MKGLKLFVWEDVLTDYTDGVMFALAPDVETAREMLSLQISKYDAKDLAREPKVYTEPFALAIHGGG
jgi:hypothetical protein